MNWKLSALLLTSLLGSSMLFSQSADRSLLRRKGNLVGFNFNLTDFYTPNVIKETSLGHVLSHGGGTRIVDMAPGFSVTYWRGLADILDFSFRYNGVFTRYQLSNSNKSYANELEGALHLRAMCDDHLFQPFLTGGIGVGQYGTRWAPYTPVGLGLQFNFNCWSYLFIQGNYRISLNKSNVDDNLVYSVGLSQNLTRPKTRPPVKTVPVPMPVTPDRDKDGVPDDEDECPDESGLARFNGCPDTDGDGIPDKVDKCPRIPGVPRYQGCPIPDTDGDGINDEEDKCPTVPGPARYRGCPIPDRDGDGINDEEDRCPDLPGPASNHGCPVVKEEVRRKVEIAAKNIFFQSGSAKLLNKSYASLNGVVSLMNEDKNLKLDVDGYTDNTGSLALNQRLSADRARSVRDYMVSKGIHGGRIRSAGHGPDSPITTNTTAAGRAKNRRVEMKMQYWEISEQ